MSEEQEVQSPEQEATEKEARTLGWVPQSEYRDGEHFVDAETFVKRGREINPILRKNNEKLMQKLNERDAEIADIRKTAEEFKQFQKDVTARKVSELQSELENLKEKKKQAVTAGDGESVVLIDDAIDIVKEQQAEAKKEPVKAVAEATKPVVLDPAFVAWQEDNSWFTKDEKYTRIADAVGAQLFAEHPELKGKAFFERLDEELEEVLPAKFKKATRGSPVEGGTPTNSRPNGSRGKNTFENLPADAKEACNRFVKQGLMKKDEYVAMYYENE